MTLRFTPKATTNNYAVFLENYGLTLHEGIGGAKNRIRNKTAGLSENNNVAHRSGALLLKNIGGEWFVLHDVRKGERFPWVKDVKSWRRAGAWNGWKAANITRAVPMTNEEYAEWRLEVERERNAYPPKQTYSWNDVTKYAGGLVGTVTVNQEDK